MNVLVVDDEATKRRQVVDCLSTLQNVTHIEEAISFQSAIAKLKSKSFEWVVLDMRLTTYDLAVADTGGRPRKFGGEEVLRKMSRRGIESQVIVLTQYSLFRERNSILMLKDIESRLRENYSVFVELIPFKHSNDEWRSRLIALISSETE